MLRADELARVVFPLGDATKEDVRAEALARGLPGADKGESQELCFVPHHGYADFVAARAEGRVRPGAIVDDSGKVLASHGGVHGFTIGQRKGLGVALGKPAFVVGLDASRAAVVLGSEDDLLAAGAVLSEPCWSDDVSVPFEAEVRVRSRHEGAKATIDFERDLESGEQRLVARFLEPVRAVSPGQIAVAYRGDRVLGGATIARALPRAEAGGVA
jgi:tRNA-specific 2-thiouridylase